MSSFRIHAEARLHTKRSIYSQKNNITLPIDYREFIHKYGCGDVGPYFIYGLSHLERGPKRTFWDLTLSFRQKGWPHADEWIIIGDDGSGNPYGFDKDGKFWTYDHDYGELFQVGEDFEDFILNECLQPDDDE